MDLNTIRFVESNNYKAASKRVIDTLVIHHTGRGDFEGHIKDLSDPIGRVIDSGPKKGQHHRVSAHFIIDKDGTIVQLVKTKDIAWHAGEINSHSIGIELENRGDGIDPFTELQMDSLTSLTAYLAETYNIDKKNIIGHGDVRNPEKSVHDNPKEAEPAVNFNWNLFLDQVDDELDNQQLFHFGDANQTGADGHAAHVDPDTAQFDDGLDYTPSDANQTGADGHAAHVDPDTAQFDDGLDYTPGDANQTGADGHS